MLGLVTAPLLVGACAAALASSTGRAPGTPSAVVDGAPTATGAAVATLSTSADTLARRAAPSATTSVGVSATGPASEPEVVPLWPTPQPRSPLVQRSIGCLPDVTSATLEAAFRKQFGPVAGFDNVHVIELGDDRYLWLMHDAYVMEVGEATNLRQGRALSNIAFLQEGTCFTLVHRGSARWPRVFEPGDGWVGSVRFFWPLGGEVYGDHVLVFWAEMVRSEHWPTPEEGGITRHPVGTWLAVYDRATLERQYFGPAPNPGADPQYGFAVASDDEHSYLFGNANMLNPAMNGGFANGPHPATRTYLARVPRGRLFLQPEYWTGQGWSSEPADAVAISERYWIENTMQPRLIDGQWWAVTKVDGFWGLDLVIERAANPWGPWETLEQYPYQPTFGIEVQNSYQPVLLPWRDPDGRPIVVISQNAHHWPTAVELPYLYRPAAFPVGPARR